MRSLVITCIVGVAALGLLALMIHPTLGVLHDRPGAALGVALIGLGLCLEARKRAAASA